MTTLNIGDKAPDFDVIDEKGNKVKLSDYKGKKLILYFYPKANTPGCTAESKNLNEFYNTLKEKGFEVLGVSADTDKKQSNFKEKYGFEFPLIPDTEKEIIKAYDVWGVKKMYGKEFEGIFRTTFVISEDQKIEKIFKKVKTKEHAQQILKEYEQ